MSFRSNELWKVRRRSFLGMEEGEINKHQINLAYKHQTKKIKKTLFRGELIFKLVKLQN